VLIPDSNQHLRVDFGQPAVLGQHIELVAAIEIAVKLAAGGRMPVNAQRLIRSFSHRRAKAVRHVFVAMPQTSRNNWEAGQTR
jgi:hypothetical protein